MMEGAAVRQPRCSGRMPQWPRPVLGGDESALIPESVVPGIEQQLRRVPDGLLGVLDLSGADEGRQVRAYEHALGVFRGGRAVVAVAIAVPVGSGRRRRNLLGCWAAVGDLLGADDVRVLSVGHLDVIGAADLEKAELLP